MSRKKKKVSDADSGLAPSDPDHAAPGQQPEIDLASKPENLELNLPESSGLQTTAPEARPDPDQVLVMNDKKTGYLFLPGGKLGPGQQALCDRKIVGYMQAKGIACHIVEDPAIE